jgi:hypothetical protein
VIVPTRTLVVAGLALAATACGAGGFELTEGDCVRLADEGADATGLAQATIVDCEDPHDLEVFHVFELSPERRTLDTMAPEIAEVCLGDPWEDYLGVPADASELELLPIPPDEEALADGDGEVVCTVREPGGGRTEGSLRAGPTAAAAPSHAGPGADDHPRASAATPRWTTATRRVAA